jgi:tRNA nucleotidyltransferase (CCA-adding enzyme)
MSSAHWEHFEHGADIGIRGIGATLDEAFEQAALAMSAVVTDITLIQATTAIDIRCNENHKDALLYDWLNALIYEMATRKMLFNHFEVMISDGELNATVTGEAIDIQRHQPAVEIKGATYTELAVYHDEDRWVAQCIVDV